MKDDIRINEIKSIGGVFDIINVNGHVNRICFTG